MPLSIMVKWTNTRTGKSVEPPPGTEINLTCTPGDKLLIEGQVTENGATPVGYPCKIRMKRTDRVTAWVEHYGPSGMDDAETGGWDTDEEGKFSLEYIVNQTAWTDEPKMIPGVGPGKKYQTEIFRG